MPEPHTTDESCDSFLIFDGGVTIPCDRPSAHGFAHTGLLVGRDETGHAHQIAVEW